MFPTHCEYCGITFDQMKEKYHTNYVELWTSDEGKPICLDCIVERGESLPKSLRELNEERKQTRSIRRRK